MGRRDSELLMQALGMAIGLGKDYIGYKQGQQFHNDQKAQQDRQFGLQSAQFDNQKAEQKSRGAEVTDRLNESVSNAGRSFITPGADTTAGGTTGSYGASTTGGGMNDVTPPPAPPDISPAAAPSMTENGPPSAVAIPPTGAQTMAKLQAATQAPKPDIGANPDAYAGQGGLTPQLPTITSGPPPSAKPAFTLSDGRQVSQIDPAMTPQGRADAFNQAKAVRTRDNVENTSFNSLQRQFGLHQGEQYDTNAANAELYSKELAHEYKTSEGAAARPQVPRTALTKVDEIGPDGKPTGQQVEKVVDMTRLGPVGTVSYKVKAVPSGIVTSFQKTNDVLDKIDALNTTLHQDPNAVGFWKGLAPAPILNLADKQGTAARQAVQALTAAALHENFGARLTATELVQMRADLPRIGDNYETVMTKVQGLRALAIKKQEEMQEAYGEDNGFKGAMLRIPRSATEKKPGKVFKFSDGTTGEVPE